jgi:hypothetical protein
MNTASDGGLQRDTQALNRITEARGTAPQPADDEQEDNRREQNEASEREASRTAEGNPLVEARLDQQAERIARNADNRNRPRTEQDGLLDTHEILELNFNAATDATAMALIYSMLQQMAAQTAAIRELIEAEHTRTVALRIATREQAKQQSEGGRRGWPPAQSEPLSHIG